ncbi:MAG: HAMP domain-containing sensor histidine kinase [Candidatus Aminicenantes bacterium]
MRKRLFKFLTGYVLKLRVLHILIIIFVSISMLVLSERISFTDVNIMDFLTTNTEGSLSEYNTLLNMLIVEINKRFPKTPVYEKHLEDIIKGKLYDTKKMLEEIRVDSENSPTVSSTINSEFNIDKLQDDKELYKYLDFGIAKNLSLNNLNLEAKPVDWEDKVLNPPDVEIDRYIIQTKPTGKNSLTPGSFVFLPTQLTNVDENNKIDISPSLKREIVFSKIAEKELRQILREIPQAEQAYFISLRGFTRILRGDYFDQVKIFKEKFSYKHSFIDRTYFAPTLEKEFRPSFPYLDIGGLGIVRTYTISILNPKLKLVGIIGVDTPLEMEGKLKKTSPILGIGFFKNVSFKFSEDNLSESEKKQIDDFKKHKKLETFFTEVNRSVSNNRVIYSVPLTTDNVVYVIFDKKRLWVNTLLFMTVIAAVLAGISGMIYYVYRQSIKAIRAQENQFNLISNMHYPYIITNKNSHILKYNQEFENLVETSNLEGANFEDFLTEDSVKDYNFHIESSKKGFECPLTIKGRKDAHKSIILINARMEHPFQKGSRISVIIDSEVIESIVAKKYIDGFYHTLKTPLHSILNIADQFRRKSAAPRYNEYYTLLDNTIEELKTEMSSLLEISKLDFRHLRPEPEIINFSRMIEEIKREFSVLVRKKKIKFDSNIHDGLTIQADRNMVKTTIENILDNALKYTPAGEISLLLLDAGSEAKVVIKDTGIGIPPDEINLIFDKEFRGKHPLVREMEGQGIGLYRCRHFVKLNNGEISVTSDPKKGSEFTIVFPKKIKNH